MAQWANLAGGGAIFFVGLTVYWRLSRRAKEKARRERLRREWGRQVERGGVEPGRPQRDSVETEDPTHVRLDDQTWGDLLLDDVLERLDRTLTAVGSQTLYHWVRRPPDDAKTLASRQAMSDALSEDRRLREQVQEGLLELRVGGGKHLTRLLWGTIEESELPLPLLRVLPLVLIGSLVGGAWLQSLPLLGLAVIVFVGNVVVHNRSTHSIAPMLLAMEDVGRLVRAAQRLKKAPAVAQAEVLRPIHAELTEGTEGTGPLVRKTVALDFRDPFDLSEYLKTVLLMEVNRFYWAAKLLHEAQPRLRRLFDAVGALDVAQATASLHQGDDVCAPRFVTRSPGEPPSIEAGDLRHPLLSDPVGNDVQLKGHSLLVSGSNMSGKTTYLRTVAVNAVLAQSLGVVFGESWSGPPVRVASCINIRDDLLEGTSYFRAELEAILAIVRRAESGGMLLVLDEIFRGTNPLERTAAATAVLDHLAGENLVLAATHDLAIGDQVSQGFSEAHFCEVPTEDDDELSLDFDYRLRNGRLERPNAIALLGRTGY
ncbi:MAG: hypothetical protein AB1Z98_09605, partial [Nannocystaceae bacterium]